MVDYIAANATATEMRISLATVTGIVGTYERHAGITAKFTATHKGGGYYVITDGTTGAETVRGRDEAEARVAVLNS